MTFCFCQLRCWLESQPVREALCGERLKQKEDLIGKNKADIPGIGQIWNKDMSQNCKGHWTSLEN